MTNSKRVFLVILLIFWMVLVQKAVCFSEVLRYHTLVLDGQNKILPWYTPSSKAYDFYLDQLWKYVATVPNGPSSSLPMYFLYCGFNPGNPITPNSWENDWGERLPNWVEFGRLYYAYTGDMGPLNIAKSLVDYSLDHATTPSNFVWPNFPIGTANAGATEIRGANVAWSQWDVLVDLASDMGMSFYRMYLIYGDERYRTAAINTADVLASKIKPGDANNSPWPYVVNAGTGAVQSRYCANWAGALTLFDLLINHSEGNVSAYLTARQILKNWILQYPMQNGNWVDGHSDVRIDGKTNWSNTCKSNMNLYLLDHPDFDPNFMTDVPKLLKWTEDNFVYDGGSYPPVYYGASVVSEQFAYPEKMGYQTSRLAAEYAAWYAVTGDATYKDRAYRGFNYSTYMMKENGEASDGPTDGVGFWWSDIYGEGPRMFFYGFMAVPEWAPPSESHILYSRSVLKNISYATGRVQYTPTDGAGIEYLRLAFLPIDVTVNGVALSLRTDLNEGGYTVRDLGNGDYAVNIRRMRNGNVVVFSGSVPVTFTITASAGTGGTISPSGNVLVNLGADATFLITPNTGYGIADANVDGGSVGTPSSYTFPSVSANHTIVATFSEIASTGGIIGYNGEGTTRCNISDSSGLYINATRFQASANLNVATIKAKVRGITGKYKCAIYSDNGGLPQTLLKESAEVTNPATGWQPFALTSSQSIVSGTYYWLAIWSNLKSTRAGVYCDPSGATTRWTNALTYGTWPSPITTTGGGSYKYCIYAEDPGSNSPPTVATAASASPNPVTGTATALSVLGADDGGEANLTYTWATSGTPPAPVTFSANGTNGAKNTTATYARAGSYSFQVTINDQGNLTVTSSVNVTVNQTLTTITVSPASASVNTGATQQFTATATDQFGTALSTQPSFSWTVSGGGTISSSGLFTAGASAAGGPYTVTASSGGKSGTASVTVTAGGAILGNNVVGTSTDPSGRNDLNSWRFQAGSSFTANNMKINLATGITGKMKVAIYSDNNGSPGSLLVGSNEITNPSSGWVTFSLTGGRPIISGTYYWLAVWSNVSYTPRSQATGGTARYITKRYGAWPNPLTGTNGPYTNKNSIFAY